MLALAFILCGIYVCGSKGSLFLFCILRFYKYIFLYHIYVRIEWMVREIHMFLSKYLSFHFFFVQKNYSNGKSLILNLWIEPQIKLHCVIFPQEILFDFEWQNLIKTKSVRCNWNMIISLLAQNEWIQLHQSLWEIEEKVLFYLSCMRLYGRVWSLVDSFFHTHLNRHDKAKPIHLIEDTGFTYCQNWHICIRTFIQSMKIIVLTWLITSFIVIDFIKFKAWTHRYRSIVCYFKQFRNPFIKCLISYMDVRVHRK